MSTGALEDRVELLMVAWEVEATVGGLNPDSTVYWDEAWPGLEPRRWTKPTRVLEGL